MMKKSLVILSLTFLTVCLSSCTKKAYVKDNKILNIALTSEVSTLDPVNSYDTLSSTVLCNIYEQLYDYHYLNRPYELKPLLAEAMPTIENKGLRYVIKIKKNIRYHDHPAFNKKPRYVTAHDFITQFKRLSYTPLNSTGWWILDGAIVGVNEFKKTVGKDFEKFKSTPIKGVYAKDDQTLVIELTQPSPQFIYKLTMSFLSPIPLEVAEYNNNDLSLTPVGTGPFYFNKMNPDKEIYLTKFPEYHDSFYPSEGDRYANSRGLLKDSGEKLPFLDGIHFVVVKDNESRWKLFNENKLDFIVLPQDFYSQVFDDVGNLREDIKAKNIRLQTMPTLTYWWLAFNMKDPLLGKNINLRKAIAHVVNMDVYIQNFTFSTGQKANSILPPGILGYNPSATLPYEYDLEKAKEFLAKAGYPEGKNLPEIIYDTRGEAKNSYAQAEYFKNQLALIGIKLKIVPNTFKGFLEKSRIGQLQFFQDGWTLDYPDAENVYQLLISTNLPPGPNISQYNKPEMDRMYENLIKLADGDEKKALIIKMEKLVNDDLPWIMQHYSRNFILYHDYLKNYRPDDLILNYAKYLRVK